MTYFKWLFRTPTGLTWHDTIPQQEIWLKLGGDKGHGSFKLNLQLCNVLHPNSQKNTCLLSMCMAIDSTTNLHTCLDMYREQMSELQGMKLRFVNSNYLYKQLLKGHYHLVHLLLEVTPSRCSSLGTTSSFVGCTDCPGQVVCGHKHAFPSNSISNT